MSMRIQLPMMCSYEVVQDQRQILPNIFGGNGIVASFGVCVGEHLRDTRVLLSWFASFRRRRVAANR